MAFLETDLIREPQEPAAPGRLGRLLLVIPLGSACDGGESVGCYAALQAADVNKTPLGGAGRLQVSE